MRLKDLFKRKPETDYDMADASRAVRADEKREQERRKWCVEQATYLEELRPESIIAVAERIYKYVYGERESL